MIHSQEKSQSIERDPEMTVTMTVNIPDILKGIKENTSITRREMEERILKWKV